MLLEKKLLPVTIIRKELSQLPNCQRMETTSSRNRFLPYNVSAVQTVSHSSDGIAAKFHDTGDQLLYTLRHHFSVCGLLLFEKGL